MAAMAVPAQGMAQSSEPAAPPSSERRLSPDQIEKVLADAAKKREAAVVHLDPDAVEPAREPQVHGEVGFAIGTGGYREVFGTAIYPLGDDGVAAISLDFVDWGKRRFRR
jgi:hypothetical protein